MGKRADKPLKKLLRNNPNLPNKIIRKKFEKQYTIEARQWFQKNLMLQKKKIRCHLNKVPKEKKGRQSAARVCAGHKRMETSQKNF